MSTPVDPGDPKPLHIMARERAAREATEAAARRSAQRVAEARQAYKAHTDRNTGAR